MYSSGRGTLRNYNIRIHDRCFGSRVPLRLGVRRHLHHHCLRCVHHYIMYIISFFLNFWTYIIWILFTQYIFIWWKLDAEFGVVVGCRFDFAIWKYLYQKCPLRPLIIRVHSLFPRIFNLTLNSWAEKTWNWKTVGVLWLLCWNSLRYPRYFCNKWSDRWGFAHDVRTYTVCEERLGSTAPLLVLVLFLCPCAAVLIRRRPSQTYWVPLFNQQWSFALRIVIRNTSTACQNERLGTQQRLSCLWQTVPASFSSSTWYNSTCEQHCFPGRRPITEFKTRKEERSEKGARLKTPVELSCTYAYLFLLPPFSLTE